MRLLWRAGDGCSVCIYGHAVQIDLFHRLSCSCCDVHGAGSVWSLVEITRDGYRSSITSDPSRTSGGSSDDQYNLLSFVFFLFLHGVHSVVVVVLLYIFLWYFCTCVAGRYLLPSCTPRQLSVFLWHRFFVGA